MTTPIILSAGADFTSFRSGDPQQQAQLDAGLLVNTYREPLRIRELNWNVLSIPNADIGAVGSAFPLSPIAGLKAKISVAGRAITQDYVNIGAMAPSPEPEWGITGGGSAELRTGLDQNGTFNSTPVSLHYRWVFPKPLDLAPGQAINVGLLVEPTMLPIAYASTPTSLATKVRVSFIGQLGGFRLEPVRPVPFVSQFVFRPGGPQISEEGSLGNPFAVPLEARRLIIRRWNGGQEATAYYTGYTVNQQRMTIMGPNGYSVVRDGIDLDQVVCASRRAWDFGPLTLRPNRDYFQIRLVDSMAVDDATTALRIVASLVSTRMENF
jgi:hypothetical protein